MGKRGPECRIPRSIGVQMSDKSVSSSRPLGRERVGGNCAAASIALRCRPPEDRLGDMLGPSHTSIQCFVLSELNYTCMQSIRYGVSILALVRGQAVVQRTQRF